MNQKTKMMIAAAAMSGLLAGSAARSFAATPAQSAPANSVVKKLAKAGTLADKAADDKADKHDCKGKNACKGKGGCKSGDNACKGKNSCKGKGGCATDKEHKKEAALATGTAGAGMLAKALADDKAADKHDCKGKNACKGKGGCKSGDNACKGKNSCKGKGGCATNKEEKKEAKLAAATAGAGVLAKTLADDKGADKHDCKGKNACKGKGGCKSGDNACKGKNSCKGKGGCATNKEKEKAL